MICWSSSPTIRRRPGEGRGPRGFTLVELLVVILILAVLIALLLPAINAALRTAKNTAVGGEINQLAQALAQFKAKYGDYPPSRIYLSEDGNLQPNVPNQSAPADGIPGDITYAQLGQRSIAAMRKFFPRVTFNFGTAVPNKWYDFNGDGLGNPVNGGHPQQYILHGHECLVFFLGGIPQQTATNLYSMTGFGNDPTNPFTNSILTSLNYSANRQAPFYEFVANRLVLDPTDATPTFIPGYLDSLGNANPTVIVGAPINFYVYFSAYGNGGYDPNDVNFVEYDASGTGPLAGIELAYRVNFPILPIATPPTPAVAPAPNPYTNNLTAQITNGVSLPVTYLNPQSFQIISSGLDGLYGVGGQYAPNAAVALPLDTSSGITPNPPPPFPYNTTDTSIRYRERDNITNIHNGRLD